MVKKITILVKKTPFKHCNISYFVVVYLYRENHIDCG